ncbi:MAG: hypothetical protein IJP96_02735 [Synergistaceae bacterium]|nr:hypothetical protein [Synergistaceae bacterium]
MRFLGSLLKYFIYLCLILIAAGSALFYFDTGSWLILPLAQRAGNFYLSPLKLEINNINGSVKNGYSIEGLKLISNDENLFTLDYVSVSPDWNLALKGLDGVPFINSLEVRGISSDLDKINKLVNHFSSDEDKADDEKDENENSINVTKINPVNILIKDVNFGTPFANLKLDEINLDKEGNLFFDSNIISGENIFPLKAHSNIDFESLNISSDLLIGSKGTGNLSGNIKDINAKLFLTALSLEEILKFLPYDKNYSNATGRLDGKIFVESDDGKIFANGVISMPRANIMEIPLNFRLPFKWNGENVFELENANLNTKAASLNLNTFIDIATMKIKANGEAKNISLNEIGKFAAPDLKLKGEGGYLKFDVDTIADENILKNTRADIEAKIPSISAMNLDIVKSLESHMKLTPKQAPKISLTGMAFGGKLFARGEAEQDKNGNIKPQAVVSLVNLDVNTLAKTFPDIAKTLKNPSGKITLNTKIHDNLNVDGKITSDKLILNGIPLTNIIANLKYDSKNNTANLENLDVNLGKGFVKASGNVNLNDSTFVFNSHSENLDPKIISELKGLTGTYKFNVETSGKYTDVNSIKADFNLNALNAGYSGMPLGNLNIPVSFANNVVKINNADAKIKGGSLNLNGNINIKNTNNPNIDLTASTNGINLSELLKAYKLQDNSMPVSGKVSGVVSVKGALKNASVIAHVRAENVKAGDMVRISNAKIDAKGNTQKIMIEKLEAKINGSEIRGGGNFNINQKNFNDSSVNICAGVKRLALKPLLTATMGNSPVEGVVDVNATLKGTVKQPQINLNVDRTIHYGKTEISDIKVKLQSPEQNHFLINAAAKVDNALTPEADIDVKKNGEIWTYKVDTKPIDINKVMASQVPSMNGIAKGFAKISVQGDTKQNSPIKINASSKEINLIDKVKIKNLSLPLTYSTAKNTLELKNAKAVLNDGIINSNANVDLNKKTWNGKTKVSHLDFGELAKPFMPEGEIVGSVDVEVTAKGSFNMFPTSFANGKFKTSPGYVHKMSIIDKVTPTKKITFEEISGTFFWDGKDVFLNPGTGARADKDEKLYRYFTVNGSMGIPGKNLRLLCDGRFDLKILDQLLGAMRGVFQYMTGGLATNFLKDAAGRMLGAKRKDFQNVSFTLANSWTELRLLNLKITKPIEDFLPIDILNKNEEKQKQDTQFTLKLKFPTGKGEKGSEEESTEDQFKQQLIDNLFNFGR